MFALKITSRRKSLTILGLISVWGLVGTVNNLGAATTTTTTTTCHDENGQRTCCEVWKVTYTEGDSQDVIKERTVQALQRRIDQGNRINRMWCRNVPGARACTARYGSPTCDTDAASTSLRRRDPTPEERETILNGAYRLTGEWQTRLMEAIPAPTGPNPYSGVNRVATSYYEALMDARERLRQLNNLLATVSSASDRGVFSRIDQMTEELRQAGRKFNDLQAQLSAIRDSARTGANRPEARRNNDDEIRQTNPGVTVLDFPGAKSAGACSDLSGCLRVDAVWDAGVRGGVGIGEIRVTVTNTCSSPIRAALWVPNGSGYNSTYFRLGAGQTTLAQANASRNEWNITAASSNAADACLRFP